MYCCSNCFEDPVIRSIIESNSKECSSHNSECDICGSSSGSFYEIRPNSDLSDLFNGLISVYTPLSELPDSFPKEEASLLKDILFNEWRIFNIAPDSIQTLLTGLCEDLYIQQHDLFDSPVALKEKKDESYLRNFSILKTYQWEDFLTGIKTVNRFHSDYINKDKLEFYLHAAVKKHKAGEVFYRSRICHNEKGYKPKEMGAPPKSKPGRVNPEGIRILYLSSDIDTTLYEVRAGQFDYVSVGKFILKENIEVIDFTQIEKISPFANDNDLTEYAVNINHLKKISGEIAKPLRNESVLDYLPTQFISDFIRSKGYSGIEYRSTLNSKGTNIAVFKPELLKCTKTYMYDIESIHYNKKKLFR